MQSKLRLTFIAISVIVCTLPGCKNSNVSNFNKAVRKLDGLLNTVGNDDLKVIAACSDVENAFKQVDLDKLSREQADAMSSVERNAKIWRLDMTAIQVAYIGRGLGSKKLQNDLDYDIEMAKTDFPRVQQTIRSYLAKYD